MRNTAHSYYDIRCSVFLYISVQEKPKRCFVVLLCQMVVSAWMPIGRWEKSVISWIRQRLIDDNCPVNLADGLLMDWQGTRWHFWINLDQGNAPIWWAFFAFSLALLEWTTFLTSLLKWSSSSHLEIVINKLYSRVNLPSGKLMTLAGLNIMKRELSLQSCKPSLGSLAALKTFQIWDSF